MYSHYLLTQSTISCGQPCSVGLGIPFQHQAPKHRTHCLGEEHLHPSCSLRIDSLPHPLPFKVLDHNIFRFHWQQKLFPSTVLCVHKTNTLGWDYAQECPEPLHKAHFRRSMKQLRSRGRKDRLLKPFQRSVSQGCEIESDHILHE